ncbi:MAG: FAD-dependent oxidoreductase [Gemmatimonadetes bacterium]|nr:FAD-dependent oxidoreductase [Gemmatimonadota bacterium]MBT5329446.1 FAD-dependent oxidoreductase [Gemmatimonadota bacterium]MBT5451534.1 FAD-dependent oxidoreductase [Gemmatimonadota bacterium]MBT5801017.1 FAD-dependent oxidoreductase [Gemmatimonadota bacterium]MBT6621867.1 FAD-dependent oxidoreductase [Gemmatimonadota bacterium]
MSDVIVIGGGPAGSTVAALVAEAGHNVQLFERENFPRFSIGESLMPDTYWTFKRLGVLDKLKASAFPRKHSVQFFGKSGRGSAPFYFSDNNPHESSVTWQVQRGKFDLMLLDNARDKGAEIHQGARVLEVLFDGDRAIGVRAKLADGQSQDFTAPIIVDATGQSALIGRKLKITEPEAQLNKASIYTHYSGGRRDEGKDEGATLILHTDNGDSWFWYIPLPDDIVSVGVVGAIDYLVQGRKEDAQTIFEQELAKCAPMQERLQHAEQLMPAKTTKDFSYRASRTAGEGWVLVGDAFCFLDPMYSSGVYLALKSGEMAADAIIDAITKGDFSAEQLGGFSPELLRGTEAVRKMVYAFYSKDFNFGEFLKRYPDCKQGVIDVLSGNLFSEHVEPIFGPMGEMCELPNDITLTG